MQEIPFNHKQKSFYCEYCWTLAQVAHRSCGVCLLGDIQNPNGHGHEQPAVVTLLERRGRTRWPPEVPSSLSNSVILCAKVSNIQNKRLSPAKSSEINGVFFSNVSEHREFKGAFTYIELLTGVNFLQDEDRFGTSRGILKIMWYWLTKEFLSGQPAIPEVEQINKITILQKEIVPLQQCK